MVHTTSSKTLWLVQPRLDASEYRDKLIGSVVKYPDLPTESRVPYHYKKLPKDIVSDLDPKAVQVHNVEFWTSRIKDDGIKASVNDIFKAFGELAKQESKVNRATVARTWHMDLPSEKFNQLLKDKEYFKEVFELLRNNHGHGYFITDIVTLVNLEVSNITSSSKGVGISAQIPVDPSLGIDVGAGAKIQVSKEDGYSVSYEDELIVFLGYRLVNLEKVDGMRAKLGRMIGTSPMNGFAVRGGLDYKPMIKEKPVEGTVAPFMSDRDNSEEKKNSTAFIANELGFDVEIFGGSSQDSED